ncbi:glutaminyl-peptide cyclotransferase [Bowmanella denitrificans]|uniref:Glutaminyl-peptide cyclotransferase n=1 Tax=Bowmanella denitrificans TaxID=366582 RepID=A0ABN0XPW7_9ALTE
MKISLSDCNFKLRHILFFGIPKTRPVIKEILPHTKSAFTQGLDFSDGALYESTGLKEHSSLRRINPATGEVEVIKSLQGHWGEGIANLRGEIVQLTWQSGKAIVYKADTLEVISEYQFTGEGWGLAPLPDGFLMTDGTENLYFRDANFNLLTTKRTKLRGIPWRWLNDITYVDGKVYANRLADSNIYQICAKTAKVTGIIDCSELVKMCPSNDSEHVLNGIAFNEDNGDFYLTGKCWEHLFRVDISF